VASKRSTAGPPTQFPNPSLAEARALHALVKGEATPQQQKIAWNFIVLGACGAGRDTFVSGHADVSAYLAGRRSVAVQLSAILERRTEDLRSKGEFDL